ncbi:hypothetical protein RND81_04G145700 [Saponaria officinalis]|uniref:RRM domain-containing protein n=1 Tax=Saponaria officinalis TaxID=3572 RepID=A0AAW1LKY0_SAPOF
MEHLSHHPYYLHHHHDNHRQPPPEYLNHHETTISSTVNQAYIFNNPPISTISATKLLSHTNIPKEQRHINTLFVSGLPDDVLPREIHNIFRRRPGFDFCQLKFTGRGNQVVAFVTFFNHQSAVLALQALDGIPFDPQDDSILHIELARSNSRRKRKSGSGPYVVIDKRRKAANDADDMSSEDGDNGSNNSCQSGDPNLSNDDEDSDEKSDVKKSNLKDREAAATKQKEKTSDGDLQPCSTLFIANLGPKCSEEELRQALSQYPGFNGLKMRSRGGMPIAFADYEEVEQATNAMEALQDSTLPSSDRGGMLIEYARSKMRKP